MQTSYMAKHNTLTKKWYHVDANDKVLGRLASTIAMILMGKHQPIYTPHVDTGDFVIVTNVEKIKITGNKKANKLYYAWSGYPGGLKIVNLHDKQQKHPEDILLLAVRRMLPKSRMGRQMLTKLKVYAGDKHPHQAQSPKAWAGNIE